MSEFSLKNISVNSGSILPLITIYYVHEFIKCYLCSLISLARVNVLLVENLRGHETINSCNLLSASSVPGI